MDYKKLIPSQKIRLKLLGLTDFIPDKLMVHIQYRIATGRKLDLNKPERFTEKIQWYKLYYRDPLMTQCADKFGVRDYVATKGYEDILVPLYGVYNKAEEIDFDALPNRFVLKTTNGSQTNILCEDKELLDKEETMKILNNWLTKRSSKLGREWSYYNIEPKIICEEYLVTDDDNDLIDYKFLCFNGEPFCLYVIEDRFSHRGLNFSIYDTTFKKMNYTRSDMEGSNFNATKPNNFDEMLQIAKKLSEDFPHVRVDFYNINGEIYIGELTFYDASGYQSYKQDEFDFILGKEFKLPEFIMV